MIQPYPTVLTVVIGFPFTIVMIIIFAIFSNGNGKFEPIELFLLILIISVLIVLGTIDLFRWDRWKQRNR